MDASRKLFWGSGVRDVSAGENRLGAPCPSPGPLLSVRTPQTQHPQTSATPRLPHPPDLITPRPQHPQTSASPRPQHPPDLINPRPQHPQTSACPGTQHPCTLSSLLPSSLEGQLGRASPVRPGLPCPLSPAHPPPRPAPGPCPCCLHFFADSPTLEEGLVETSGRGTSGAGSRKETVKRTHP